MDFSTGLAEGSFAEQRLVVAHDPIRAAEQSATQKTHQEFRKSSPRNWSPNSTRRTKERVSAAAATDRGAYSRFQRAVSTPN